MFEKQKSTVQTQFGKAADAYVTSKIHAKGESLSVLARLIKPQADWVALDVATGAGHTALMFAPHVKRMIATDLTAEMLAKTEALAAQRQLNNVETKFADAEELPFDDAMFDLVTCRIALHHFPHAWQAITEFARVLKPGGYLGFTDNITVPNKQAAGYYNAYEKLRDPSHHWVYPAARLQAMFEKTGFIVEATEQISKEMAFTPWADRMQVSAANREKLLTMVRCLPETLQPMFQPRWVDEESLYFSLWEWVCVARKQ